MTQLLPLHSTRALKTDSDEPSIEAPLSRAESLDDVPQVTRQLSDLLARTAVDRDKTGGHAAAERELIRQSGLLALTIPTRFGGLGGSWPTFYKVVRELARVDAALAHVFAFHHLQIASVLLYGDVEQQERLLSQTIKKRWFWGNALNPLDKRTLALATSGGFRIRGTKNFCSGSVGSDMMTFSAWHEPSSSALIAVVPTKAPGVDVRSDWDAFGQKQTDSGTVNFHDVHISRADVLQAPGLTPSPHTSLRTLVSQLILTNLYLGVGEGAFAAALRYTKEEARPWLTATVQRAHEDPYTQHRYGEFRVALRAAQAVADDAARALQAALDQGSSLDAVARGDTALAVSEAKVLAHRAGLEVSSQFLELTGARSTTGRHGFDRFWRNVRVHTLHDPVDYRLRDLGRHAITGQYPEASAYT
ncbi:MAG TPA: acyl-CoA dehydrogenase family protein [Candidatus Aquabacterium excrementipullorum]|nr:acyl-CoA dehydrogenase family protein [Candidatus Aquabacterium excrementipullorum]